MSSTNSWPFPKWKVVSKTKPYAPPKVKKAKPPTNAPKALV